MEVLRVANVHAALPLGMALIAQKGIERDSRNGPVKLIDGPVTTLYERPEQRVIFWPERDANPFFHFMEGLWMIAGRNDVAWLSQFSSNIAQFSDDGVTFHGAYGHRWINHFAKEVEEGPFAKTDLYQSDGPTYVPFNQLECVAEMLRANPDERRALVTMWSPEDDLGRKGKDVPCNLSALFSINVRGSLDMTVTNRSNDMIWGAYGANAVHFSMLQEFMASWIGVAVGRYWQVSNNFHAYVNVLEKHRGVLEGGRHEFDYPYSYGRKGQPQVDAFQMVNEPIEVWLDDLAMFMEEGPVSGFRDVFFRKVVAPMWNAWWVYKDKDNPRRYQEAIEHASQIKASDWRLACVEWLERRAK